MDNPNFSKSKQSAVLFSFLRSCLIAILIVGVGLNGGPAGKAAAAAGSTTDLIADPDSAALFGQAITFTASVLPGQATGTVIFDDGGTLIPGCENVALGVGNAASCTVNGLAIGVHAITATYSGDTAFALSSAVLDYPVNKADTLLALLDTVPASPVINQEFTFDFSVSASAPGSGIPTGSVQVREDGITPLCAGDLTNGAGSCSVTYDTAGFHNISLEYSGDANFNDSSTTTNLNINDTGSSIELNVTPSSPIVSGQEVTFTAAVSPAAATGFVFFFDNGVSMTDCLIAALDSNNNAVCTPTAMLPGNHAITAYYFGDSTYSSSFSNAINYVVAKAGSTTTLMNTSPASPVVNQAVTFNYSVIGNLPSLAVPIGTVGVREGSATLCSASVIDGACTYTFTTSGVHNLTIQFFGDSSFDLSSAHLTLNIESISSSTSLELSTVSPAFFGQPVTLTATVSPGPASGTVAFTDGGSAILGCSGLAVSAGQAVCSPISLSIGDHTFEAFYAGDTTYSSSLSPSPIALSVVKANTLTSIITDLSTTSFINQGMLVSASVTEVAPSTFNPTGSVTIGDGVDSCTAALSGQTAACLLVFTSAGSKTVTASFHNLDGTFQDSASTGASHNVSLDMTFVPLIKK